MNPRYPVGGEYTDIARAVAYTLATLILLPYSALFLPLPVIFYRIKLDRAKAAVLVVIALVYILIQLSRGSGILIWFNQLYYAGLLAMGLLIAELILLDIEPEWTVIFAGVVYMVVAFITVAGYCLIRGTTIVALTSAFIDENIAQTISFFELVQTPGFEAETLKDAFAQTKPLMMGFVPAVMALTVLLTSWTNRYLGRWLLSRRGLMPPDIRGLSGWQTPEPFVWGVIAGGMVTLLPGQSLKVIGVSGLIVTLALYLFQGIAVTAFFFQKKNLPRPVQYILYALMILQPQILMIVVGIGLFDTWINFRTRFTPTT